MYQALSVIVLFHNNERFDMVIHSIRQQLNNDDEIIIVNDHSDTQYDYLLNALSVYQNITIINAEKCGNRSYNRNLGAKYACNPFLVFVDGDIYFPTPVFNTMRASLCDNSTVGVYGNLYGHASTPFTINTTLGFDYLEILFNEKKWQQLKEYSFLQDARERKDAELLNGELNWNYFYTNYCMIKKDAFEEVGQFDENFETWGAEDVDLGYRLSLIGKIKYEKSLCAFHIPHARNKRAEQITNWQNMYYMLAKYKKTVFEIKISYNKSIALYKSIELFFKTMRLIKWDAINKNTLKDKSIYCNIVSKQMPNGNIVYISPNGTEQNLELLGLALPFPDKFFGEAIISYGIFLYPCGLAARIIQEFLRIADKVYIYNDRTTYRINWGYDVEKVFKNSSPFSDFYYICKSYNDFNFVHNCENGLISVTPVFSYKK